MPQRAVDLLPGADTALDMAGRRQARVLRSLHGHRGTLAERAVEYDPLAGRLGEFVQHAAGADAFLQARIGYVQRTGDHAVPLALAFLAQIDQRHVRLAEQRKRLPRAERPAAVG